MGEAVTPYYERDAVRLYQGDCRALLAEMPDASVDSVVTDPPYELGFMGKKWDSSGVAFQVETWEAVLRVLKQGGHLLAFGGTRTYHRMTCAIEDAGFEIRDCLQWIYGSGFPKSANVSKQIDKQAGAERPVVSQRIRLGDGRPYGDRQHLGCILTERMSGNDAVTAPATDAAKQWDGWGTGLKPAYEPIVLARKPLVGTVAANVQQYGTGAINIDGCRVNPGETIRSGGNGLAHNGGRFGAHETAGTRPVVQPHTLGRWPANVIHDGSDEVLALFPSVDGPWGGNGSKSKCGSTSMFGIGDNPDNERYKGSGSAARFFYCAKSSRSERGEGNTHPTVKPLALMRYLVKLITPPNGTVLDPFAGSGTTLLAAEREGFASIGIEQDAGHCGIIQRRLHGELLPLEAVI